MRHIFIFIVLFSHSFFANAQCSTSVVSSTSISCFGSCNGTVNVTSTGGTGPYTYTLNPNIGVQQIAGQFVNLCASVYTIVSTDALSCTSSTTVVISEPPPITTFITNTIMPSCVPGCDGLLQVSTIGGTQGYFYTIQPGNTINGNGVFSGLCGGVNYFITATDANGCTSILSTFLPIGSGINVTAGSIIYPTCLNANGSLSLNATGGSAPYQYAVNNSVFQTSNTFTNLSAGTYTFIAQDVNGCSSSIIQTLTSTGNTLTGVTTTSTSYNESCVNAGDGSIDLTVTPSAGLTYVWSNGAVTQDIYNLNSGNYAVTIYNGAGDCLTILDTINSANSNCGTISGKVYIDSNSNCTYNTLSDFDVNNQQIQLSNGSIAMTNPMGEYTFNNVPLNTFTIAKINPINLSNACTQPTTVVLNAMNPNVTNIDFKDSINTSADVGIYVMNSNIVPGFNGNYFINVTNYTSQSVSTLVSFVINNDLNYLSSTLTPASVTPVVSGDSLTWSITIPANTNAAWNVNYITPTTLPLGTPVTSCAKATINILTDINLTNNNHCNTKIVVGSYDPNDKAVSPVGDGVNGKITLQDKQLDYKIRFQNTGTYYAQRVVIRDTLSSKLDINSLKVMAYSHMYTLDIVNGNVLVFTFDNIMLPDSNTNEPASHGYIAYSIKQKNTNVVGDVIKNTAHIYFDFNTAIVTNTTINTISFPLISSQFNREKYNISLYPNPAKNTLNIDVVSAHRETINIELIDPIGAVIHTQKLKANLGKNIATINTSQLAKGTYILKMIGENNSIFRKVVIE